MRNNNPTIKIEPLIYYKISQTTHEGQRSKSGSRGGGGVRPQFFRVFTLMEGFSIEATSSNSVELVKLYKNAAGPIRLPHSQAEVDLGHQQQ